MYPELTNPMVHRNNNDRDYLNLISATSEIDCEQTIRDTDFGLTNTFLRGPMLYVYFLLLISQQNILNNSCRA